MIALGPPPSAPMNHKPNHPVGGRPTTALLLTGGGARAAYQVGVLRSLVRAYPDLHFPILTGVSAGAINVAIALCARLQ